MRKSELRVLEKERVKTERKEVKIKLEEKYDGNLKDSDDSSDEEVLLRTGNVPQKWYELYDHSGYTVKGEKVAKMLEKDELQKFVERQEDKMWWTKIIDHLNNKEVRLSMGDLEMLKRIKSG